MFPVFPRGIEVLLKKASVDPEFRQLLLENPDAAAESIELQLDPTEVAMLRNLPTDQLETIIDRTEVPQPLRRAFLGTAAATMLAVLAGSSEVLAGMPSPKTPMGLSGGMRPPGKGGAGMGCGGIRADIPPGGGGMGIRPDEVPQDQPRDLPHEIVMLVHEMTKLPWNRVKPMTRLSFEGKELSDFRQAIYDRFEVRMPMKTLKSLRTVKLLTEYVVESHEGYIEKEKKE